MMYFIQENIGTICNVCIFILLGCLVLLAVDKGEDDESE